MKRFRLILPMVGLFAVLVFGASATASISSISSAAEVVNASLPEPLKMLFVGFGLIGCGYFIKRVSFRN